MVINTQQEAISALMALAETETLLMVRGEQKVIHDVAEIGGSQIKIFWKDGTNMSIVVSKVGSFLAENKQSLVPQLSVRQQREQKRAEMVDDMTDSLYAVFGKLKEKPDRELIDQAHALCSTSATICNMWKLQLTAMKMSQTS
jgi:dihydroxyacetone kinase